MARNAAAPNRKLNIALVVAIVLVAVGAFVGTRLLADGGNAKTGAEVVIRDADGNERRLPLSQDCETTVATSAGTNVVQVKDGKVCVREADCPNQDCVEQGWISDSSQQIVCLPHKLTVSIEGPNATSTYDVIGR
ncbi:NusG domain II-containing protein [Paratractidigestivibacter sp.]|uniref:NusG domain II-containing protein n=1 Tax=Paratractidigestivibacter sp. TaxID=2847316 RepID=UPI002AC8DDF7|nr:NusG domain II-containing protein [Paratractidigestivibacter sp.]